MVWLLGLNKFNKLCLLVNPQEVGKNFLINLINKLATPAIIAKVTKIPNVKTSPLIALFNIQKENKKIKSKIAKNTKIRAFLGFC